MGSCGLSINTLTSGEEVHWPSKGGEGGTPTTTNHHLPPFHEFKFGLTPFPEDLGERAGENNTWACLIGSKISGLGHWFRDKSVT